jgi:hypothetical protein
VQELLQLVLPVLPVLAALQPQKPPQATLPLQLEHMLMLQLVPP